MNIENFTLISMWLNSGNELIISISHLYSKHHHLGNMIIIISTRYSNISKQSQSFKHLTREFKVSIEYVHKIKNEICNIIVCG